MNVALTLVENKIKPPKEWFTPNKIYAHNAGRCNTEFRYETIALALAD